jgi:hypothetical protein
MDTSVITRLETEISRIARTKFVDAEVESVHVTPDWDADGDPILRIRIVLSTAGAFDAVKAKGLTRDIFPALKDGAEGVFPILSFVSKTDYARLSAAA